MRQQTYQQMTAELREILQDEDRALELGLAFANRSCNEMAEQSGEHPPEFESFFREALQHVVFTNIKYVFFRSGSPIETIFLNSLIMGFMKADPLGLATHDTFGDADAELANFRESFEGFKQYIAWCGKQGFNLGDIEEHLDSELAAEKMDRQERDNLKYMLDRYYILSMQDSFHMTLQPKFPNIKLEGKSIRPDILFWIPTKPEVKVIVECDGFDYHSDRLKFTTDRKRDRELQSRGFQVLRFSGSEIYKDPAKITAELAQFLWELGYDGENEDGETK